MYAIISELNTIASNEVKLIWQRLSNQCDLESVYLMPTPHLTWVVCQELNSDQAVQSLSELASKMRFVSTHTTGLGVFSGLNPVLYLPVVKTQELLTLHQTIWNLLLPMAINRNVVYSPGEWVPHITIAINDLIKVRLECAINCLVLDHLRIDIILDNLSIAKFEDGSAGDIINQIQIADEQERTGRE